MVLSFYGEKERNVKEDIYISNEKNQRKRSKLPGIEQGEKEGETERGREGETKRRRE